MVCLEDVADITLPPGSCKFDYLAVVGNKERLMLLQKEGRKGKGRYIDEDELHFLTGIDLHQNPQLIKIPPTKNDDEKMDFTVDNNLDLRKQGSNGKMPKIVFLRKDKWKKKLMGSFHGCLSWQRSVVKPVVQDSTKMPISISTQSKTPDSVISHSSDSGSASSNKITKRLRYDENGGEAMAERKINSKKAKRGSSGRVPNNGPEPPPGLPVEYRNLIRLLAGDRKVSIEKLVIQKELTVTDVNDTQNRLSIPVRLVREAFLTEPEELYLCQRNGKNVNSIDVPLITPMMEVANVSLRRWEMRKQKGVPSVSYVIAGTWNEITRDNKLQSEMIIQLWAIRIGGKLWFAIARCSYHYHFRV